jgi:hypothetical protein
MVNLPSIASPATRMPYFQPDPIAFFIGRRKFVAGEYFGGWLNGSDVIQLKAFAYARHNCFLLRFRVVQLTCMTPVS